MPKPMLGGRNFREIMAELGYSDGLDLDKIDEAIELMFTNGTVEAAKLLREVKRSTRLKMKLHTLLQANDVEEAKEFLKNEIRPALESGKDTK